MGGRVRKEVFIDSQYITLGNLLKKETIVSSGGQEKWYLKEHTVDVNSKPDDRRGRKLYPGDTVDVKGVGLFFICINKAE